MLRIEYFWGMMIVKILKVVLVFLLSLQAHDSISQSKVDTIAYKGYFANLSYEYDLSDGFYIASDSLSKTSSITACFSSDIVTHEWFDSTGSKTYIDTLFKKSNILKKVYLSDGVKKWEHLINHNSGATDEIEITFDSKGTITKFFQRQFSNLDSKFHLYIKSKYSSYYINNIYAVESVGVEIVKWMDAGIARIDTLKIKEETDGTVFELYPEGRVKIESKANVSSVSTRRYYNTEHEITRIEYFDIKGNLLKVTEPKNKP